MQPFTTLTSQAMPLDRTNVDTDQIIPKQFLKRIERTGYGDFLFFDWRQTPAGEPVPDFVLNDPRFKGAKILIAGKNFGCGSSREHAVWGLQQYGFQAVIAPSFAEIFYSNAMNNRLLLVQLERDAIDALTRSAIAAPHTSLSIDLEQQTVTSSSGEQYAYPIDARHKRMVIEGMDTVDLTLDSIAAIEAFERSHFIRHPWARVM